jgi:hypothetical protein
MHAEVQRGGTIIEGSMAFRGKNNGDRRRGRRLLIEGGETGLDIGKRKDGVIIDRDHVGADVGTSKGTKGAAGGRLMNGLDVGATEAGTRIERETQGGGRIGIVRNRHGGERSEKLSRHIEVRDGHSEVENVGPIIAETIQEAGIGRFIGEILH